MTTGNRERFKDRVREIYNKNKIEEEKTKKKPFFFIKVIGIIGSFIFERDKINNADNTRIEKNKSGDDSDFYIYNYQLNEERKNNIINNLNSTEEKFVKKEKYNNIKRVIPELLVKKKYKPTDNNRNTANDKNIKTNYKGIDKAPKEDNIVLTEDINTLEKKKEKLEEIKSKFTTAFDKLEILQSELYVLNEVNDNNNLLKETEEKLKKIKKVLEEIDKLKEKFEYLKKDYDFEYIFKADKNNIITHEIIELNSIFSDEEARPLTKEYKLLDLYNDLYKKVEKVEAETKIMEKDKERQIEELKKRNIDFEDLKREVLRKKNKNKEYDSFIKKQNELLEDLDKKVSKIDSHEVIEYQLKGYNDLLRNYFKYSMLFLVSPLRGLIPSIARETLITRNTIKNLKDNMTLERKVKMVYEGTDYSSIIGDAIYDLKYANGIINKTLEEITSLKKKYNDEFREYQKEMPEYLEVMNKINDIEKRVLSNKRKVEVMKNKMYEKERKNAKKLILIKDLNNK